MIRRCTITALVLLSACASTPKPDDSGTAGTTNSAVEYRCESGDQIVVRIDGVSAGLRYNGVDYVLPQLSNVAGVTTFSDGRHLLEIRQNRTFFALGRAAPRLCTAR